MSVNSNYDMEMGGCYHSSKASSCCRSINEMRLPSRSIFETSFSSSAAISSSPVATAAAVVVAAVVVVVVVASVLWTVSWQLVSCLVLVLVLVSVLVLAAFGFGSEREQTSTRSMIKE